MAVGKEHPPRFLLDPTGSDALRAALERLRANGLSSCEAAAEMLRRNFYDFVDAEAEPESGGPCPCLRIIKR